MKRNATQRAQQRAAWQALFRANGNGAPSKPAAPHALPRRIDLQIAELELRGVGRTTANRIAAAFETQLGHLIAGNGIPEHWRSGAPLVEVRTSMRRQNTDHETGEALARAVLDTQRETRR